VYGRAQQIRARALPKKFPARQSYEASRAVARVGRLPDERSVFVQQDPRAIDAGAFHNDVVMVADGDRILLHEHSWTKQKAVLRELRLRIPTLKVREIKATELNLGQAVRSYLFNSQLLSTPAGHVLLAPSESRRGASGRIARRLVDDGFVVRVIFQELAQSMAGGGGPACLRLRIPLAPTELAGLAPGILLTSGKIIRLEAWAKRHYRDRLVRRDLADPELLTESREALDELTSILDLGSLYPFQR
jgi:succinylarginine dihydrolase